MNNEVPGLMPVSVLLAVLTAGCSKPMAWPPSPLHEFPAVGGVEAAARVTAAPGTAEEAMKSIVGHYAHYDVVAYEDSTTRTPMRTFVISYGFTDFYMESGKLYQKDRFLHAEYKINQKYVRSAFDDASVMAIQPRIQEVQLEFRDGRWNIYRPPSPVLLGIRGDASLPLSKDPEDPGLLDPDGDGKPGVTVDLTIAGVLRGKLYITRREIYSDYLARYPDGRIYGWVKDASEQFTVGANLGILRQPSNPVQVPDPGMNPVLLVPIPEDIDTWEELKQVMAGFFPPEPGFVE